MKKSLLQTADFPNVLAAGFSARCEIIPVDIRAVLEPQQIERLLPLLTASRAVHTLTYRVSTQIGDQRYYFAAFCGTEKRSALRLKREDQSRHWKGLLAKVTSLSLCYSAFSVSIALVVPLLFIIVTYTLGIELFPAD